ncbi:dihydrofolate reductase family protein [Streptomyces sp. NPDC045714]|uniref:dihydrofolate reductase family protein n=1 Tax=Streptomyces sp. NPDC045714 TaxID=3154913 RepID=UPI00340AC560
MRPEEPRLLLPHPEHQAEDGAPAQRAVADTDAGRGAGGKEPAGALAAPLAANTPVFVVTHEKRDPWELPGGTTFHFVNDGIESALDQAREAAGDRDVRIAGGGATILEYVNAGLIDEFSIALSPVLFGSGIRLFEGVDASRVALKQVRAEHSPRVTHVTYTVRER